MLTILQHNLDGEPLPEPEAPADDGQAGEDGVDSDDAEADAE